MTSFRRTAGALAVLALLGRAQTTARALPLAPSEWLVPIHTLPDDPVSGPYGRWAAGPDYKVCFDDGFTFYPVLGTAYPHNLPLRWRTERITVGAQDLVAVGERAAVAQTPWRHELRYGAVTEAYDVLTTGVEQTFVVHAAPAGHGDLVVRGRVTTELAAVAADDGIHFRDAAGTDILRYGRAVAFDAKGRRTEVATVCTGDALELRLAQAWLADAAWPVTIDPLTASTPVAAAASGAIGFTAVARDNTLNRLLVTYSRASSASDWDLFGRLRFDDFQAVASVFSDVSVNYSSKFASVAFVRGANRWLVGFDRDFGASAAVRLYLHDAGDQVLNSGAVLAINAPAGQHDRYPSVAGHEVDTSGNGYVVFQRDAATSNTADSRVFGALVDAAAGTVGAAVNLHANLPLSYDAELPCITQNGGTYGFWVVVWQEQDHGIAGDDWDVACQRIDRDGTVGQNALHLSNGVSATRHKLHPIVAGFGDRFLVSYLLRDNLSQFSATTGNEIVAQRFDWAQLAVSPVAQAPRTVVASAGNTLRASVFDRPIAYDRRTRSHWALAWRTTADDLTVARLGSGGGVVEQATVWNDPAVGVVSAALCHDDDAYEFPLVFATNDAATHPVFGARLGYPAAAQNTLYGLGCVGTIAPYNNGPRANPYLGSEFFGLELSQGVPNAPTVLFLGRPSAPLPLPGGCHLNLDPGLLLPIATAGPGGYVFVPLPIPDTLPPMDLCWQFFQVDPAGNVTATRGLRTDIR